jgi:hypothetical protein
MPAQTAPTRPEPGPPHRFEGDLAPPGRAAQRVLLVGVERALAELLSTWLADDGWSVLQPGDAALAGAGAVDLVIFDVPFPRQGGAQCVRRRGAPCRRADRGAVVDLSARHRLPRRGGARPACRLRAANPVSRGVLIGAVRRVLPPSCDGAGRGWIMPLALPRPVAPESAAAPSAPGAPGALGRWLGWRSTPWWGGLFITLVAATAAFRHLARPRRHGGGQRPRAGRTVARVRRTDRAQRADG